MGDSSGRKRGRRGRNGRGEVVNVSWREYYRGFCEQGNNWEHEGDGLFDAGYDLWKDLDDKALHTLSSSAVPVLHSFSFVTCP